jgi:CheY-like chemotaxis protein
MPGKRRPRVKANDSKKPLVLLVEDEDDIRLTFRDYLKRAGYTVLVASDGVGAIKQLLDHEADVIITDYRMDILGGDYWIKFLKRYCSDKKVIITSGFLRPELNIPFEVICKPFEYADLEKMIIRLTAEAGDAPAG